MQRREHMDGVEPEDMKPNIKPSERLKLGRSIESGRLETEGESARDHVLYRTATPRTDGLFHCPWEGQLSCNHKPDKLKCNYE